MNSDIRSMRKLTPEQKKKLEDLKRKSAEAFRKLEEQVQETVGDFNPSDLMADPDEIITIPDPMLGNVKFGLLDYRTYLDIADMKRQGLSGADVTEKMIFAMLKKAYPEEEVAKLRRAHGFKMARVTMLLSNYVNNFLQGTTSAISSDGLMVPPMPKQSGSSAINSRNFPMKSES